MKFTHFSDCHIGSWRDEKMNKLGIAAFKTALQESIAKKTDFILIGGDLFNSALPPIDNLKEVVIALKELKQHDIPCYVIPGSHDYSSSGKTMIEVLEHAGLLVNVCKGSVQDDVLSLRFTTDAKTGAKITGIIGKKGMLDRKYYEKLNRTALEQESGFKIFMFHTALTELKPKELEKMDSAPLSLLPKGFDYYAGGHVHTVNMQDIDEYKNIAYPGALFPNNFREIEECKQGGYYLYDNGITTWNPIVTKEVAAITIDCNNRSAHDIQQEVLQEIKKIDAQDKIITIRLKGVLSSGKIADIPLQEIVGMLYHKGAYYVMKSTTLLSTKDIELVQTHTGSIEETEQRIIAENAKDDAALVKQLMQLLSMEKQDGETKHGFEKRLTEEAHKVLNVK